MENFEKLKLSATYGSEPHQLDYLYDMQAHKIKRIEFFTSNVTIDKTHWFYSDRYEDVSIYYFKSESANELVMNSSLTNLHQLGQQQQPTSGAAVVSASTSNPTTTTANIQSGTTTQASSNEALSGGGNGGILTKIKSINSIDETSPSGGTSNHNTTTNASTPGTSSSISASLFIPQKNESFNDKLKLWKCCTLVKHPALTLEKIVHRIKYER